MQCCTCSKWVYLRCSLIFSQFNALGNFHSWSCPPCFGFASSICSTPTNTVTSSSGFSSLYTSIIKPGPSGLPLPMQRSRLNLAYKHSILLPPTSYLLYLHPLHPLMILVVFLYLLLLSPLNRLGFFSRMPEVLPDSPSLSQKR